MERLLIAVVDESSIQRRAFLSRALFVGCVGVGLEPQAHAQIPLAWLSWAGRQAFSAGTAWLAGKVLDWGWQQWEAWRKSAVVTSDTKKDTLHAYYSDYDISHVISPTYSPTFNTTVEVDRKPRANPNNIAIPTFKDLNTAELKRICLENQRAPETLLSPCNYRQAPTRAATAKLFGELCPRLNDAGGKTLGPDNVKLAYTRPFNDGRGNVRTGYAVESTRFPDRMDLIIDV